MDPEPCLLQRAPFSPSWLSMVPASGQCTHSALCELQFSHIPWWCSCFNLRLVRNPFLIIIIIFYFHLRMSCFALVSNSWVARLYIPQPDPGIYFAAIFKQYSTDFSFFSEMACDFQLQPSTNFELSIQFLPETLCNWSNFQLQFYPIFYTWLLALFIQI